ncbi:MAG: PD-(D/E)XK nuclease family protein, partial [Thermoanaerobaculia bacterium]|nr:PD-(D/E)XK nuclease family protein [Thermoanaerobaculia bacterium]
LPERMSRLRAAFSLDGNERDTQRLTEADSAVQILTIHKAKGLEAAVVFVTGGFKQPSEDLRIYHRDGKRYAHIQSPDPSVRPLTEIEALSESQRLGYVAVTRARHRLYLPLCGKGVQDRSLQGPLQDRLAQLIQGPAGDNLFVEVTAAPSLSTATSTSGEAETPSVTDLAAWRPALPSEAPRWSEPEFDRLRRDHAALTVTSYTQLTRHQFFPTDVGDEELSEDVELPAAALPGGREVGIFLHELLERLDYSQALAASSADELFEDTSTSRLFLHFAHRHGVASEYWPEVRSILYAGLRTPIDQPALQLPRGLAPLEKLARESEFLFPVESQTYPGDAKSHLGPTFVQGVIDLLFQHEGRFFVADWKSDRRSDWSRQSLEEHVAEHYALQARLYAIAAGRMLEIHSEEEYEARFGGVIYCFLRGMDPAVPNHGIHFERPSWATFRGWSDFSDLEKLLGNRAS